MYVVAHVRCGTCTVWHIYLVADIGCGTYGGKVPLMHESSYILFRRFVVIFFHPGNLVRDVTTGP